MNFSVEKNINVKKRQLKVLRQEMIEKEKLHINDSINYEKFLELYNEYGKELSQEDFARIYLDISISNYYNLKSKKEIKILKEEEIEDEYICRIKLYIIKNLGLTKETGGLQSGPKAWSMPTLYTGERSAICRQMRKSLSWR